MFPRFLFIAFVFPLLSGCIATPRFDMSEPVSFNYVAPVQQQTSYSDALCCDQCRA